MRKFNYFKLRWLGIALVFGLVQLSNGASERHTPWIRWGQERIEKYRMAAVNLEVHLPDGSLLPSGSLVELELQKHAFQFGSLWLVVMCCIRSHLIMIF